MILLGTVEHCSEQCCIAWHCLAWCFIASHCIVEHSIACLTVILHRMSQHIYPRYFSDLFLSSTVSIACDRHKNVSKEQTCAQLLELEQRISDVKDTVRGIVFVSTKTCARMLKERLKATFPSLAVDTVLGQSVGTGMAQPAQRKVINAFKRGGL